MLDFIKYLRENFNEDTSSVEKIIQTKWNKVVSIIKEAFDDPFADKKTAIYKIQNEFVDKNIAPKTIDIDFLKNNMDYVIEKVNSLDEGEIRIIINNDVQKGAGAGVAGVEMESAKKKVGRKKKVVEEDADETETEETEDTENNEETEEEKVIKVSVKDNKVTVEPSENTGLEKSDYDFETEEEANAFIDNLETLFKGFKIDKGEEETDEESEETEDEEEVAEESHNVLKTEAKEDEETEEAGEEEEGGEESEEATEEEKSVKVSVDGTKVTVEPSENTGLEKSDYEFESEEEANNFVDSLETLFKGFKIDKGEGESEEDSDEEDISWEDIDDAGEEEESEEEVPVKAIGSKEYDVESLDLTKLINNLVNVQGNWYKVTSIAEDKKIVTVDKDGKESSFDFAQIDEMECDISEMCSKKAEEEVEETEGEEAEEEIETTEEETEAEEECPCKGDAEECMMSPIVKRSTAFLGDEFEDEEIEDEESEESEEAGEESEEGEEATTITIKVPNAEEEEVSGGLKDALTPEQLEAVNIWLANPSEDLPDDVYEVLMDYYAEEMPYGTAKARTGDQYEWLFAKVSEELGESEEEFEEPSEAEEEVEETETGEEVEEESLSFAKLANRYLDEDVLTAPKMLMTQGGGLTSKVGKIDQTIMSIKPAPKAPVVKAPTAALTAKPGKPNQKVEKIPSAPSAPVKKGPQNAFSAKPKAPPKKVEKVKAAPKMATKAGPKSNLTSKPGKTGQKVEKVKAPVAPNEYKKGGFKG